MQLSKHFTLNEFTYSMIAERQGIPNEPAAEIIEELKKTAELMEQVRSLLGNYPIRITSGYRSTALNKAIGGSSRSQHCRGQAADFKCSAYTPRDIALKIAESDIMFDQLIYEGSWVHISQSEYPRRSILTAIFEGGGVRYEQGVA